MTGISVIKPRQRRRDVHRQSHVHYKGAERGPKLANDRCDNVQYFAEHRDRGHQRYKDGFADSNNDLYDHGHGSGWDSYENSHGDRYGSSARADSDFFG